MLFGALLDSPLLAFDAPEPAPNPIEALARARGAEVAVILEVEGYPRTLSLDADAAADPILGNAFLGGFGAPGENLLPTITPVRLMLSDAPYRTAPDDPLWPNMWTEARMTRRADIEQSAPVSQGAGRRAQETTGDLEFSDDDGYLRGVTDLYSFDGRPANIYLAGVGRPWADAVRISAARVANSTRSRNSTRIALEDAASALDAPLIPRIYGGGGLRDGSPELKGSSPPGGWGLVRHARPLLEDPGIYIYRLADEAINSVVAVEEAGLAFAYAGDVASYELLRVRVGEIAEGSYASCLDDGSIAIRFAGGSPAYPDAIRATFEGAKSGGSYVAFLGDVLFAMLRYSMGLPGALIDRQSLQALPREKISYYFPGGAPSPTGAQALNDIMESAYGAFGSIDSTRIGARLFYPPSDQSAAITLREEEIFSADEVAAPQAPIYLQEIGWGPNWSPLRREDIVAPLSEPEIAARTQEFAGVARVANAAARASNVKAVAGALIRGVFDEESPSREAAQRIVDIWSANAKTFEIEAAFVAADVARGSVISMTHRDLGAKSGRKFLVYNKRLLLSKRRVLMTVVSE